MTISYNWLSDYLPEIIEPEKLSRILTSIGLEVESLEKYESIKGGLAGLVIGEVLECIQHPNADKLKLTKVSNLQDREENRQRLKLAEQIKNKREQQLQSDEYDVTPDFKQGIDFIEFFDNDVTDVIDDVLVVTSTARHGIGACATV